MAFFFRFQTNILQLTLHCNLQRGNKSFNEYNLTIFFAPNTVHSDKNIQSGQHDSAEDARIALLLYKRYRELQAEGPDTVRASISELYETGRRHGWKVPDVTVSETPAWADTDNMWTGQGHDSEDDILDQTPGFFESQ